ncbi:hypothetical protein EXM36_07780 [Clostridium botulinum]|uniref:Uncharacterized protein n=1 Tax=Clostridium botulinum TaxID=1491 RepID=A0A2I4NIB1_CLOBO|nr:MULTISPECIES: hypothetical protein [Clostridium]APQ76834.1 hypothetical protein RSJ10_3120 [Clostridium botulinum]AUN00293.1 hypothetical protein RSJ13_15260 [Clostridium botulinum]EJE7233599.1 hypothetical protein [Clostridium botulinum]EKO1912848.1 hypothetical protein [Clostridium botulinum]EKO2042909.1 hypothetical protein [Clostridium botulinum]
MAYGRNEFGYYEEYQAVASSNQGSFNNPRQKMWMVQRRGYYAWEIELITNSFEDAKDKARFLLDCGGEYMNINRVMVSEIVPMDNVITPSV